MAATSTRRCYTAGPWRVGDAGATIFGPKVEGYPAPVIVATLPGPSPRVSAEERAGNRRLLAAAPDLARVLADLQTEIRRAVRFDVRKHYSLMVADVAASKILDEINNHGAEERQTR